MNNFPVKLGLLPPLTGIVELYGPEISRAAQIACDEINDQGGVLGRRLELIIEDDGSLPETAVPAARRLVEEHKCAAIIGNLLSNSRIAVNDRVAEPFKIPFLNFSFYEGSISGKYFFNFAALPNQQIEKMIPYMEKRFGPKMFFAGANYEWPRGSIDACKISLLKQGGEIVGEEYFEIGTTDFDELLSQVERSGADVFVPYAAGNDQLTLLTEFTKKGLKKHMAVVMGHYDEVMMTALSPKIREGFFSSNTYFMSIDTENNKKYLSRLAKQPGVTGIWPQGNGVITNFGEGTYICVHAFAKAANMAESLDTNALLAALETISVQGPQGTVIMDPVTHHASVNSYLSQCQSNGTFKIIEQFGLIDPEIPERYKSSQKKDNSSFDGVEKDKEKDSELIGIINAYGNPVISKIGGDSLLDEASMLELIVLVHAQNKRLLMAANEKVSIKLYSPLPLQFLTSSITATPLFNSGVCTHFALHMKTKESGLKKSREISTRENVFDFGTERQNISSTSDEILANTDSAIIATDIKGIIVQANKQACKIFNYPENELLGLEVHLILPPHLREAHKLHFTGFVESDKTEMVLGERGEITGYRKDGSFFPAEASIAKIESNDGVLLVATLRDISGRKKQEDDLLWRATHDPLTGLPNRSLIKDRLNNALARSERTGNMVVLMFIDLDQFKIVNDSYGHDAGDDLLVAISNRLVEVVRPGDTVARFGGDEFIVLCDQITDENIVTQLVERIIENVKTPVEIEDSIFYPTVSIGIVGGYGSEMTAEQMLQNADTAMYIAKDQGRDGWKVYDDDIGESTRNHLRIANGLRQAVERNQLEAYYQPIVDVESHEIVGSETLLRWKYEGEMISPAIFIPIAEMTGSIVELGYWVFEASCKQQTELRKHFSDEELPYISINLSARQLTQYNLIERFESIIEKHNVSVKHLVIEITESTLMIDIERSLKLLHGLGDIGLSLAIDDFGTGHSSLSRIKSLPVDTIKVDQTFIRHIHKDSGNQAITKAVIEMAHALGLKVTAEGVEEIAELNVLKDLHCNRVQGYLFDKPLTADQFMVALLNHKQGYQLAG